MSLNIESVVASQSCMGCLSCSDACPVKAISIAEDAAEGFLRPTVDSNKCVDCGLCVRSCPASHADMARPLSDESPTSYVVSVMEEGHDEERSSSSGIAYWLGYRFINRYKDAEVFGCAFDSNLVARHISVHDEEELVRLRGSKYVQSNIAGVYKEISSCIGRGQRVLFFGTPCQVDALRRYVGHTERLVTVDIFCHGVPSPGFWKKDVEWLGAKHGLIRSDKWLFRLRDNKTRTKYHISDSGSHIVDNHDDPYYSQFMSSGSLQEACYKCRFASQVRAGDLSIGDCAIADAIEGMPSDVPVSTVVLNTRMGLECFEDLASSIAIAYKPIKLSREAKFNMALSSPPKRSVARDSVYLDMRKEPYELFAKRYCTKKSARDYVKDIAIRCLPEKFVHKIKNRRMTELTDANQ